jgi:hypothetical protein
MQLHTVPGLPQLQFEGLNNSDLLTVVQLQLLELLLLLCRTREALLSVVAAEVNCCAAAPGVLLHSRWIASFTRRQSSLALAFCGMPTSAMVLPLQQMSCREE